MIKIIFYQNTKIVGFKITNHGRDIVCSAVSILSLNTVNSIEMFTDTTFDVDYDTNGGFLIFSIEADSYNLCEKTQLLLNSLELGLKGILAQYPNDISLKYKEVQ